MDTFYGSLSIGIKRVWVYLILTTRDSLTKDYKQFEHHSPFCEELTCNTTVQLYLLAAIFLLPTSTTGLQLTFFDLLNARPVATPSWFLYIDK